MNRIVIVIVKVQMIKYNVFERNKKEMSHINRKNPDQLDSNLRKKREKM